MASDDPQRSDQIAQAEQRVRAEIEACRSAGDSAGLALRHAELGMVLAAQNRFPAAIGEFRTSLGYIDLLRADGSHEQARLLRMTSAASPPPQATDVDLDRLEVEIRVAMAETMAAAGDLAGARTEVERVRPQTRGFFRRKFRHRLDRVAAQIAAGGGQSTPTSELRSLIMRTDDEAARRALRLKLANGLLDDQDYPGAANEALLLLRVADEAGDVTIRAGARQVLGLALEGQGRPADGLPILSDAFRDLVHQDDVVGIVGMGEALAVRLADARDFAGAATVLRTTISAAGRQPDHSTAQRASALLGSILDEAGDRAEAITIFTDAAITAEGHGDEVGRADALHGLAVTLGNGGDDDDLVEALALLEQCKRTYEKYGYLDRVAGCEHEAAALLGRRGSMEAAAARYQAALQRYQDLPPEQRDTGHWPDEVADCERNLSWLTDPTHTPPAGLFASGGHAMSHRVRG